MLMTTVSSGGISDESLIDTHQMCKLYHKLIMKAFHTEQLDNSVEQLEGRGCFHS